MRCQEYSTELTLASRISPSARLWIGACTLVAGLYILRAILQEIPPQDHVALALILCMLLTQAWLNLKPTVVKINLSQNRCWLKHRNFIRLKERSLPVTQIHSAKLEFQSRPDSIDGPFARIVLITSLGMIPVNADYQANTGELRGACDRLNRFLESHQRMLSA